MTNSVRRAFALDREIKEVISAKGETDLYKLEKLQHSRRMGLRAQMPKSQKPKPSRWSFK